MQAIAKVFTVGNSQAIRIPKAFRLNAREVWIAKNAATGEITLRPKPTTDTLQALLTELQQLPTTPEFIPQRNDSAHKNWTF